MEYTINELRQKIFKDVYGVYGIFKNHFGEQYVDLQGIPTEDDIRDTISYYDDVTRNPETLKYEVSDSNIDRLRIFYHAKYKIYVWFPRVTVTNEHDRSIVIWDLYVLVEVNIKGRIPYENWGMLWNRSHYNKAQWLKGYLHSHINGIPKSNLTEFRQPCLGRSTILDTIKTLKDSNDEAFWMLFCEEISQAVTIESLTGRPYYYLEQVGDSTTTPSEFKGYEKPVPNIHYKLKYDLDYYSREIITANAYWLDEEHLISMLKDFTTYYLKHGHFSFCFKNGKFDVGLQYYDFMIDISNAFIDFYNKTLKEGKEKLDFLYTTNFLKNVFVAERKFNNRDGQTSRDFRRYIGKHVLTFKGQDITLQIDDTEEQHVEETTLLNQYVAMYILGQILKIVNYRFKNGRNKDITASGTGEASSTRQTVCYI